MTTETMPRHYLDAGSDLRAGLPTIWWNSKPVQRSREWYDHHQLAVQSALGRFARFAPLLSQLFPETASNDGRVQSVLMPVDRLSKTLDPELPSGRLYVKGDHDLPITGSIKARGGLHAVISIAEEIGRRSGVLKQDDYLSLLLPEARDLFASHSISVGSTGNLGLSIGTVGAALNFATIVHMSSEARDWKKATLRSRGTTVIEHAGDYADALSAARISSLADPACFFIDDEDSEPLLYGYAAAASELEAQLSAVGVTVDADHPLIVHLPCGVGGAPAGIALGLHLIFGTNVRCFFAEPVESPCFMLEMICGNGTRPSIYDAGRSGKTEADGLAVPRASLLAAEIARTVVAGTYTVTDTAMLQHVYQAAEYQGLRIETSAAAGMAGPSIIRQRLRQHRDFGLGDLLDRSTQVIWTTGGRLMPDSDHADLVARGRALSDGVTAGNEKWI